MYTFISSKWRSKEETQPCIISYTDVINIAYCFIDNKINKTIDMTIILQECPDQK